MLCHRTRSVNRSAGDGANKQNDATSAIVVNSNSDDSADDPEEVLVVGEKKAQHPAVRQQMAVKPTAIVKHGSTSFMVLPGRWIVQKPPTGSATDAIQLQLPRRTARAQKGGRKLPDVTTQQDLRQVLVDEERNSVQLLEVCGSM